MNACTKILKLEGFIEKDPETKKLRITTNRAIEREKRLVINEIDEAKIVADRRSLSDASPVRYELSLTKPCGDAPRSINRLPESFRADPIKTNLSFLSHFLWHILDNCGEGGSADQIQTLDDVQGKLRNELPIDAEVLNIVSIDTKRLLTWLKTPPGIATLEYVLEQKRESRIENIARFAN